MGWETDKNVQGSNLSWSWVCPKRTSNRFHHQWCPLSAYRDVVFIVNATGPCWFCLSSPEVEKHLVVTVGEHVSPSHWKPYLSVESIVCSFYSVFPTFWVKFFIFFNGLRCFYFDLFRSSILPELLSLDSLLITNRHPTKDRETNTEIFEWHSKFYSALFYRRYLNGFFFVSAVLPGPAQGRSRSRTRADPSHRPLPEQHRTPRRGPRRSRQISFSASFGDWLLTTLTDHLTKLLSS